MEENTITVDGVDYDIDSLSDKSKHCINQIKNLKEKIQKASMELEQLDVAYNSYSEILLSEIKSKDKEEFLAK